MSSVGALYLHVPFCARKCAYCDFFSAQTRRDDPKLDEFVGRQLALVRRFSETGLLSDCVTAYVGGGTPTLLGASRLARLVEGIREACPHLEELSCEANPDSLTDEVIDAAVGSGVTRLSVGVQSLEDVELERLGRLHTAAQAKERVGAAVASGLDVSVDLMCAIPSQTTRSWDRTLRDVVSLGVGHVSVYPLSIEEGTPLGRAYVDPAWNDEDVQAERMERSAAVLESEGYSRYEVASYAKPGRQCRHNQAYWTGVPYLGVGRGAASMLDGNLYDTVREVYGWLPMRPRDCARARFSTLDREVEFLSEREAWAEDLMLGMRLTRGVKVAEVPPATVSELLGRGLVKLEEDRMAPTHDGWLLGNELYGILWDLAG